MSSDGDGKRVSSRSTTRGGGAADAGAVVSPDFQSSGSIPAPGGATAVVMARADAAWGDGYPGGQSDSVTADLPQECTAPATGRFTGGGKQIRLSDGLKITRGLTIHCDLLLSNNLEIHWPTGNKFHMLEHLETVECTLVDAGEPGGNDLQAHYDQPHK